MDDLDGAMDKLKIRDIAGQWIHAVAWGNGELIYSSGAQLVKALDGNALAVLSVIAENLMDEMSEYLDGG